MSASSDYLAAVERALEIQGQAQSNAVLQRGQIWGNYLTNVGNSIGSTVQSLMQARQDQRLREAFDLAAKRATAATMPQTTGPLDPRTVEGAAAAGGAAATPAENYLAGQPPPDQTASAPEPPGPTNPALAAMNPASSRGFGSLFTPPSMAGPATSAAPAAATFRTTNEKDVTGQAVVDPSTIPSGSTPSPVPTGTPTPPNAGAINWLLTTPKLTDKEKQSIIAAQQQGDLSVIPQSVWDKARIKKADVQKYVDNQAINAALAAGPTRTPAAAAPAAAAAAPPAIATSGAAPAASAPSPDSASSPPESAAAPAATPPSETAPPSAAAPPPAATPPAISPGATPSGATPQIPPELAAAMAGATVSPFPTPQEIIKAVGPVRGIPIINAIAALNLKTEGDPAKINAQLQAFYKGLQNLPLDMQQQAYPMLRDVAIRAAGELGPMIARVLPPNFSQVQSKYFLGQMQPVQGPPKTEAELRLDAQNKNSPTQAQSAATIKQWEADREALRRQGGTESMNTKYVDLMAKPEAQRTPAEQAWIQAYQDEKDRQHETFEQWKEKYDYANANPRPGTVSSQSVVVRGTDDQGNPTVEIKPKTPGAVYKAAPPATIQNRTASAKVALQVSDDIEQKLQDPNYLKAIGPILGRYSRVEDWWGDPPPELRELKGMFKGYSDAMTSVHGYRSPENAARIAELLTTKSTPEAIISALHGLNDFSMHLLDNENIRITKPIPGAPGMEQTYINGKWIRTK